jgi:hypothetical protein
MRTETKQAKRVKKATRDNSPFLKRNPPPVDFGEGNYLVLVPWDEWEEWMEEGNARG